MALEDRVFIYRLPRARQVVENAFGILANRFQCLLTTLKQEPHNVESIILAFVCIHNIMRMRYPGDQNALLDREDDNHQGLPGEMMSTFKTLKTFEIATIQARQQNSNDFT